MTRIKAILFDLHGTLVCMKGGVKFQEVSEYLWTKGHEVSPQQFEAAWSFVSFIDYPKYGYRDWESYLSRIFWRLKAKVDDQTLAEAADLFERSPYQLYPDAAEAIKKAKRNSFKTAVVTTIAHFKFEKVIQPIRTYLDFVMTGYEAGCDKSNPKMYLKILEILQVAPNEAVMIGDDVQLDILLPKRLGVNAIFLDREGKIKEESADASVVDLKEAIEFVLRHYGNK